jgi:DNA-binding HxlR family transcriptional regulator
LRSGYRQHCAIARTLDLVGQRWTLLIVRELTLRGPLTGAALARGLPDVPMNQVSERIARLEAQGLVAVSPRAAPARVYELTEAGHELGPVLDALARFGLDRVNARTASGDALLPHVLMRELELRFDADRAARQGFRGRFELVVSDPAQLWSVEPGAGAAGRYALVVGGQGLRARAGAGLNADASLTATVETWARLAGGDPQAGAEVEVEGDSVLALALLDLLGSAAPGTAAAAA